jgi:hypothetical protein
MLLTCSGYQGFHFSKVLKESAASISRVQESMNVSIDLSTTQMCHLMIVGIKFLTRRLKHSACLQDYKLSHPTGLYFFLPI